MRPHKTGLLLILVLAVLSVGVLGYHLIEGWSFSDSFYMTMITLTTTGFKEVQPLSPAGRYFTSFLLMIGVGTVAYSATTIMGSFMSINFSKQRRRKMEGELKKLSGHTIVCGFGRMGAVICEELTKAKLPVVVIEKEPEVIKFLEDHDYLWIEGDAGDDEALTKAGIEKARVIVSALGNDHDALYVALAARSLNARLNIIVRANHDSAVRKIKLAGADKVILPFVMSGSKVADAIINPAGEDYFDITGANVDNDHRYRICELFVQEGSFLHGKSLRSVSLKRDGLIVLGVKKADDSFMFAPDADYEFQDGDCLIAFGTVTNYERVKKSTTQMG